MVASEHLPSPKSKFTNLLIAFAQIFIFDLSSVSVWFARGPRLLRMAVLTQTTRTHADQRSE